MLYECVRAIVSLDTDQGQLRQPTVLSSAPQALFFESVVVFPIAFLFFCFVSPTYFSGELTRHTVFFRPFYFVLHFVYFAYLRGPLSCSK